MSGTLRKKSFLQPGMLKFTYKGKLKRHMENWCIENPNSEKYLGASSTYKICFFLKKIKTLILGGISKFLKLIVFG
jgi:hypothetical protein